MKVVKGNFKLSRVDGTREVVSWFNVWDRAYRAYRFATVEGFDYVQLVRARDGVVLYSDGEMPGWFAAVQRSPARPGESVDVSLENLKRLR